MSVLLQNTQKSAGDKGGVVVGVCAPRQLDKLEVCFGGFSPTAMGDAAASRERVRVSEERQRARRASLEHAAALEAARVTGEGVWDDGCGVQWHYVVLDGVEVRIEKCETDAVLLNVPGEIEGLPVVAVAPDACSCLPSVEEIRCADSILSIGPCAFRRNERLERMTFPANLATFDPTWVRTCPNLAFLALPGCVARLDARLFDIPHLRALVVGAGTMEVEPGAFAKSELESIAVDTANPYLSTDGRALYAEGGSVLVALCVPGEAYRVQEGCVRIARKGFSTFACLKEVEVPEGLEDVEAFAFSRTGIASFHAPSSLRHVGERAFFGCANLQEVRFAEGLVSLGDHAFTGTALRELRLPASVEELGNPLAERCGLTYAGPEATFSIAASASARLSLDEEGGLYREDAEGRHFVRLMDPEARYCQVQPGTVGIDEGAFARHAHIAEIDLPDGLQVVGQGACKGCVSLVRVSLPAGLRRIEDEAFLDTNLASLRLPASLEYVGENALVSHGAHHGTEEPSLRDVQVEVGNVRFFADCGLLMERKDDGNARIVLCTGAAECVRVPPEVNEIAPYAFNDVRGIRELHLSDRIDVVGVRGLAIDGLVERICVDLEHPVAGHDHVEICYPDTDRGAQQMMLALSVPSRVDVETLLEHYDNAIVNASSFDALSNRGLGTYEQAKRIVARLVDPLFLSSVTRSMFDRVLRGNLEDMCVEIARHDDRRTMDALFDLGYLDADNLCGVIDRVGALQDAAMTGYLLEAQRLRFQKDAFDFDL